MEWAFDGDSGIDQRTIQRTDDVEVVDVAAIIILVDTGYNVAVVETNLEHSCRNTPNASVLDRIADLQLLIDVSGLQTIGPAQVVVANRAAAGQDQGQEKKLSLFSHVRFTPLRDHDRTKQS